MQFGRCCNIGWVTSEYQAYIGVVHNLRLQDFDFFWPPNPLRWHFLPLWTLTKVNVVYERSLSLQLLINFEDLFSHFNMTCFFFQRWHWWKWKSQISSHWIYYTWKWAHFLGISRPFQIILVSNYTQRGLKEIFFTYFSSLLP